MKSRMNWKRGLLRLWLLAAIPWVVYAVGEFDVAEKLGYAWRYYTDQNGLVKELRSPAAVAQCVAADLALGAKDDRFARAARSVVQGDNSDDLVERCNGLNENGVDPEVMRKLHGDSWANPLPDARRISPENAAEGLKLGRETGMDPAWAAENIKPLQEDKYLEQWNKILEESKTRELKQRNKLLEEGKAREREAIAACNSRTPEVPDLRWIIPVLVAPTFGVALAAFAIWLIFLTLRWAWRGFQS